MKKLLVANNSVTVMYNAQNAYYNASTAAYSYPTSTKNVNHVVTVVGWDDNYSAKNFRASSKVKETEPDRQEQLGYRLGKIRIFLYVL